VSAAIAAFNREESCLNGRESIQRPRRDVAEPRLDIDDPYTALSSLRVDPQEQLPTPGTAEPKAGASK
jgi:hypothetical protein